jgi:hypothetical protein
MRRTRRCRDSEGAYWSGGGAMIAMRPDGKRKIQLPSGVMPRNAARTDLARNGRANVSDSVGGGSGAMRPCFGNTVDELCFVAEATPFVLPRSFEDVMFDKLACSLFFAPDSLGASPDASLASVFAFCIGSFCCANEPACSGDRFFRAFRRLRSVRDSRNHRTRCRPRRLSCCRGIGPAEGASPVSRKHIVAPRE